uniref:Protein MTSS 1-like n=1 Tax=Sphaeramia orbicularis TaxID=375764 RepID=A0A673CUR5_9TELE
MEAVIEKECSALGGLFQTVIGDMKSSYPIWEDFIAKAGKLQSQLRATVVAVAAFLDAFQKVADLATNSRGGTRDIGSALTRMCMRHRSIEAKLKQFSMGFLESLISPLQEQMEEWKRGVNTLDKDHAKEYKRARQEIKKKSSDTLKLQKKAKKGRGDIQPQLDSAMQDVSDKYILLEETEKQALRKALIEERQRFCLFVAMLRPVVDEEISMLGEVTHLQAISDDLKALTSDPHKLPPASEQVIMDLKGSDYGWSYQTPPSSPSTTMSRKSSMCSSLNSVNSSDSRGSSGSHSHSPSSSSSSSSSHHLFHHHHPRHRYRSSTLPQQAPARLSSISSHDSGFISSSQDQYTSSKSSSPMPAETKLSNGFDHCSPASSPYLHSNGSGTAFPFFPPSSSSSPSSSCPTRSWSRPASALLPDFPHYCTMGSPMVPSSRVPTWKDWAKPGPYDQPMVNTLRRKKDKDTSAVVDTNGNVSCEYSPPSASPHEELALALSRGLELDAQRSSRDSIQCSSGYSTQTNTPCCSEDTIPSQVSDYDYFSMAGDQETEQQADFDKSSTIPRNSDIGQSYRRMFQTKRPASTAGLPIIVTPGVATIRRTPSSKPSARRSGSVVGTGPIPIRTPVIPVKIPTVPDMSGTINGIEEASPLPVVSWSGQATTNPPIGGAEEVGEGLEGESEGNMLVAIRKGVKLKRTLTNDRSAPRIA